MKKTQIEYEYFEWLIGLSVNLCRDYGSYRKLFGYLYSREFYSDVENDENRAEDGLDLRMRFAEDSNYTYRDIYIYLDEPCSVLEMMLGLALRCEEHIMGDPEIGDRTGLWMHAMLESLHLADQTDDVYDEEKAVNAIDILLSHGYKRNGDGGLFTITKRREDMRKTEIWCQMCWYLVEFSEK